MRIYFNDHEYRDAKFDKVDSRCLKNVKMVKDEKDREREIGEIDFYKIQKQDLVHVFNCMNKVVIGSELRELSKTLINSDNVTNKEMSTYIDLIEEKFNMEEEGLFNLLKDYLTKNKNIIKHGTFIKVLAATCRLVYSDYDNYKYDYYDEHPHPMQDNIDHNLVGDYSLVLIRPIPFKIIEAMENEVTKLKRAEKEKKYSNFDKKHSTAELDELSNGL